VMASRILERNWLLQAQFPPNSRYEKMLIADMALAKARTDRAAELQIENEDRYIDRTLDYWEFDQEARARRLKKRLSRDPEGVAHTLSGFKQGADLMIRAWQGLVSALELTGEWDQEQRTLALDLMGIDRVLRVGDWLFPPSVGKAKLAETAAREIARLRAMKEDWLDENDLDDQDDALAGFAPEDNPTTKRLRRYENMARREYDKAFAELMRVKAEGEAHLNETGINTKTLRAWDVDSLIKRLQEIKQPPGLDAERDEMFAAMCRIKGNTEVATAPKAAPAEATLPVTTTAGTPPPVASETTTPDVEEISGEGQIDSSATTAAVDSTTLATECSITLPLSIVQPPATPAEDMKKAALSRRARKELQKRHRVSAQREAGKKSP
jgi:hypothetical protein